MTYNQYVVVRAVEAQYDPMARAAYIRLADEEVERTVALSDSVNLDVGLNGGLVGIEVLGVTQDAWRGLGIGMAYRQD